MTLKSSSSSSKRLHEYCEHEVHWKINKDIPSVPLEDIIPGRRQPQLVAIKNIYELPESVDVKESKL